MHRTGCFQQQPRLTGHANASGSADADIGPHQRGAGGRARRAAASPTGTHALICSAPLLGSVRRPLEGACREQQGANAPEGDDQQVAAGDTRAV